MSAYLVDHPPARSQYRRPRRADPSGVAVVHTAENTPDYVALDGGAEAVANFIRNRSDPGSYHDLADSDSCINLVPYDAEAYHDGTGSNPHSYGVSVATRADVWPLAPPVWRAGAVRNAAHGAARYARWLRARSGIVIPARRISRAQSEARIPGFLSHAERDPARRTDPGKAFPWSAFLAEFARLTNLTPTPPTSEDDDMPATYRIELADQNRVAYVLPDGTVVDTDHEGNRITDGSPGDSAMGAVYLAKSGNARQVDVVQAMVRRARG